MDTVNIFNVPVNLLTQQELVNEIVNHSLSPGKSIIGNVNIKALNIAYEEENFSKFLKQCNLVYCDGFGAMLGAKLLGYELEKKHRTTCADFLDLLLSKLVTEQQKIFFLGGKQNIIEKLHIILEKKHPELNYRAHHGFFAKEGAPNRHIVQEINAFRPDILYVGFGMPLQEYWIQNNFDEVDTNLFLPEGACLDFYTHSTYRAPKFLTDNGLEWLARLVTEPGRLWQRYLIGNPRFLYRVFKQRIQS